MTCILDSREHDLINQFQQCGYDISYTVETLDLADIEIRGTQEQRFLLERKTILDLAASLQDGRFKDQKDRLLGVVEREPKTAIAYILEGNLRGGDHETLGRGRITVGMIRNLLLTIQFRYRIPVIVTGSVRETALWVYRFWMNLEKKPDFCPIGSGSNAGCSSYKTLMPAPVANRGNDVRSYGISMLTVLPGMSFKSASALVDSLCHDGKTLFEVIRENSKEAFQSRLEEVKIGNRRVSKKIVDTMMGLFYAS
jgi:ERCC4-type nuclease